MSGNIQTEIGKLITSPQERDAIHVAVAPVVAADDLHPGDHVGFCDDCDERARNRVSKPNSFSNHETIGIVDPFLKAPVKYGDKFWLFLYPNTVTSLKHHWTHPAFHQEEEPSDSEKWLRDFAQDIGLSYEQTIKAADNFLRTEDHHVFSYDTPDRCYKDKEEFWRHYELVAGVSVQDKSEVPFACSC